MCLLMVASESSEKCLLIQCLSLLIIFLCLLVHFLCLQVLCLHSCLLMLVLCPHICLTSVSTHQPSFGIYSPAQLQCLTFSPAAVSTLQSFCCDHIPFLLWCLLTCPASFSVFLVSVLLLCPVQYFLSDLLYVLSPLLPLAANWWLFWGLCHDFNIMYH